MLMFAYTRIMYVCVIAKEFQSALTITKITAEKEENNKAIE